MMLPTSLGRLLVIVGLLLLPESSRAQSGAASLELDFTAPSGYVTRHVGGAVWLVPQTQGDVSTPCNFALAPLRPSKGSLEADAEAALVAETVESGMRRTSDYRIAMRGVAPGGWHYFLSGGNFRPRLPAAPFTFGHGHGDSRLGKSSQRRPWPWERGRMQFQRRAVCAALS